MMERIASNAESTLKMIFTIVDMLIKFSFRRYSALADACNQSIGEWREKINKGAFASDELVDEINEKREEE